MSSTHVILRLSITKLRQFSEIGTFFLLFGPFWKINGNSRVKMKMGVNFKKRIFLTIFCNTHPSWNNLLWNANSPFSTSEINETHFLCQKSFWIYFNILLFFGLPISIWSKFEFFLLQEIKIFLSSEFPISNGVFQICCSPIQFLGSNFEIIDEISWHGSNMSSFLRSVIISTNMISSLID